MKVAIQTVICCCVFTTVLQSVKGATGDLNSSLKKRFRVWMQSRTRRDLRDTLETSDERDADLPAGPQQSEDTEDLEHESSFALNIRCRRSNVVSAKKNGCALVTCAVHDLFNRLHQFNDNTKVEFAPKKKMIDYGRKRRSLHALRPKLMPQKNGERRRLTRGADEGGRTEMPRTLAYNRPRS